MKRLLLSGLVLSLAACTDGAPAAEGPGLNVSFLDMPAGMIPTSVTTISIDVYTGGPGVDGGPPDNSQHTVANIMDGQIVYPHLPTNQPVRVVITGFNAAMAATYVGHVGPMVLAAGERRYVDLVLYPIGMSTAITTTIYAPSILPTATALLDGRVLIAGGFVAPTMLAACPGGEPATSKCLVAAATRDAYVFLPDNGAFYKLPSGLLAARGGQSATRLSDGRVLLAGGASSLLIIARPLSSAGYSLDFQPRDMANALVPLPSFELFDPDQNRIADPLREGDPQRGGFLGAADAPTTPGRLNHGRMLHAATLVHATQGDLVLLAGGQGAPDTWEVWDAHRAGGYGVYASPGAILHTQRTYPSAITVPGATAMAPPTVWIVGGAAATSDDDLAEIWTPSMMVGNGTSTAATSRMYPTGAVTMADHPEFALSRPELSLVGTGSGLVIAGWMGPHCLVGAASPVPVWYGSGGATLDEQCRQGAGPVRSATVTLMTGAALPMTMPPSGPSEHGFGSSVTMSDGAFALIGGFATVTLSVQATIDVFDGSVSGGRANLVSGHPLGLSRPRALQASAALAGRGMLTVGGLTLDATTLAPTLVAQPEVAYLGAAP